MSYKTSYRCANDPSLQNRVTACCASEGHETDAVDTMFAVIWFVATANDVIAAYDSAVAAGNPDPGGDQAVVTDSMILSHVQPNLPPAP
jgi:hypothetical protein